MRADETKAMTSGETNAPDMPSAETAEGDDRPRRGLGRMAFLLLTGAVVVLGVVICAGIHARTAAAAKLKHATAQAAIPTVHVVSPTDSASDEEIVLPGNTQAFIDAPIFARTNGYLKRWYFDIGAYVKQGELLAE